MRGDLLVQPREMRVEPIDRTVFSDGGSIDEEVAWLIGAAVGDGTVTGKGLRLALDGENRDRAAGIITERWGAHPTYRIDPSRSASTGSSRPTCDARAWACAMLPSGSSELGGLAERLTRAAPHGGPTSISTPGTTLSWTGWRLNDIFTAPGRSLAESVR